MVRTPARMGGLRVLYCIPVSSCPLRTPLTFASHTHISILGSEILIAVGNRVLLYNAQEGRIRQSLKGHKDYVFCVAYSKDGKFFASGGADKTVIVWSDKCEGVLKYQHNDTVQCLAYNPVTHQLASAAESDFGMYSPKQRSVQKTKVQSKICCAAWTNDGNFIAFGQYNGHITIRDRAGVETLRIERTAPVWCLEWSPDVPGQEPTNTLAVGCWDQVEHMSMPRYAHTYLYT